MEELQEADVLWPWPDTPPPPSPGWGRHHPAAAPVDSSCEPYTFSDSEPAAASASSSLTLSALPSSESSGWSYDDDGFFLSGPSSVSSGLEIDAAEEFLEADVLWPDTADDEDDEDEDDAAGVWRWLRCSRRVEETASACGGKREEGRRGRPLVSSPIDIPMATRAPPPAPACRRPSAAVVTARRRW